MTESLAFSIDYQYSIIGHALRSKNVWARLSAAGATKHWLVDKKLQELWSYFGKFKKRFNRFPNLEELLDYIQKFPKTEDHIEETIKQCISLSKKYGLDILLETLSDWNKSRVIITSIKDIQNAYNLQSVSEASKVVRAMNSSLQKLDNIKLEADALKPTPMRMDNERQERLQERGRYLDYGITYLNEVTGGIGTKDLIIISSKTGVGKTELITNITRHNVEQGHKVATFVLEGEEFELERRIKYKIMAEMFKNENKEYGNSYLNYADWRLGKNLALEKYEDEASRIMKEKYSNLATYYRVHHSFGAEELEREILKVRKFARLIIIDHLNYMDLDQGENENQQTKNLVKHLKYITQSFSIPIILVAHLRKTQGSFKNSPLIPSYEDIHGSSDIVKISTSTIILGKVTGKNDMLVAEKGIPTFMRLAKHRLEGSRVSDVGLTLFDKFTNSYLPEYALGNLNPMETKWTPLTTTPQWAKNFKIKDAAEIVKK